MGRKRLVVRNRRKRKLYFSILLVCLLIIGVGYANFGTELDILGLLGIKGYRLPINTTWDYDYKEEIQTFRVPQDGVYRLETWGAQGGDSASIGGGGGYAYGTILLSKGDILYIVTGGAGTQADANSTYITGGYNGGGSANYSAGTGGGATHIATSTGLLTEFSEKQNDILLVAGGGGGGTAYIGTGNADEISVGGCGGGSTGCQGGDLSTEWAGGGGGGTQTTAGTPNGVADSDSSAGSPGSFGQGGAGGHSGYNDNGTGSVSREGSGGGGGGYYGGAGGTSRNGGGGGGSGYANRDILIMGELIAGSLSFGDPNGEAVKGHSGSGYARITLLESYKVTVSSTDTAKGQVSPSSKIIKVNENAEFTLTANSGYAYASNTCGGTVTGNTLIIENITKDITCTVTFNETTTFDYTGGEQTYTVPADGIYRLEVWGAQGGHDSNGTGGYGAYSVGETYLEENTTLYINVGGAGQHCYTTQCSGGYNGGGISIHGSQPGGSGGGATHIATSSGILSSLSNNKNSVLIVAGGGGGIGYYDSAGGNGGGIEGTRGTCVNSTHDGRFGGTGATQTSGGTKETGDLCGSSGLTYTGSFGQGGHTADSNCGGSGGGGGWYGGGGSSRGHNGAGGGSGYIGNNSLTSKHMTCYNCTTSDEVSTKTISNSNVSATALPEYAKEENGYVKITYITNQTYTVSAISANANKATISPNSRKVRPNSDAEFVVSLNSGYGYISDTCGGFMQGNVLVIPNVTSNLNCVADFGELSIFDYTGGEQTFTALKTGNYKLKVWGAQGGDTTAQYHGGYGGYATGSIFLQKNDLLYVNVGGRGVCASEQETSAGGYNGGGGALTAGGGTGKQQCSGGGASHIAKSTGLLSTFENNQENLLIVAGGGGGAGYQSGMYDNPNGTHGGNGGGIEGALVKNECTDCGTLIPATQTHAGTGRFGSGSFGLGSGTTDETSSGGGGGYYGGGSDTYEWGGSGGSGYIGNAQITDKHMVCYDCVESTEENTYTTSNRRAFDIAVEDASKIGPGHVEILYIEVDDYFTLSYHDDSGLGCDGTTTKTKSYREWGELCAPTREGYALKEWNTAADGSGTTITSTTESLQDEDVYAIWLPVHRITYISNGGDACNPTYKDQIQGTAWGTLCSPIQTGYSFEGWNTAQDGNGTTITSSSIASSDITVYAQWLEVTTTTWTYSYTGGQQTFTAPYSGTYQLEVWGGQGGACTYGAGGKGGYAQGQVSLTAGQVIYIAVGGAGGCKTGGYNGGGTGSAATTGSRYDGGGGGGATHIGKSNALLKNTSSPNVFIVAGGGGGASGWQEPPTGFVSGGSGGGISGGNSIGKGTEWWCFQNTSVGGTQTTGYAYGVGQNGRTASNGNCNQEGNGGGGGGYYGGTSIQSPAEYNNSGGGGGSGYIGGVSDGSMSNGTNSGNGSAKITFIQ